MRRKLWVTVSAAALAATAAVSACSSSASGPAPAAGGSGSSGGLTSATLKLVSLASDQPGLDKVIADWQKVHPDITVSPTYLPAGDTYTTSVSTQFSGGNGADLVWLVAGGASPTSAQAFAKQGYLADLTSQSWVSSMYAPIKPLFQLNGKVYVRDLGVSPLAIVNYNKGYFTKNNLTIPTTFSQFLSLCRTVSAKGMVPVSWGAATEAVNANDLAVLAGNTVFANDPKWLTTAEAGKATFTGTPGWRQAVQQIADMKSANCFSPGVSGVALTQMIGDFANQSAAMMFTYGGLDGNVLTQSPNLSIGMFPMPAPVAADTRVTLQAAGGLGVNAKSAHLADAEAFLDYISTPAEQAKFATASNLISTNQADTAALTGIYADIKAYFTGNKILADPTAQWPNTSFNTNAGASIQGLFTGQKSVSAVLTDMDKFFTAK
jgi:raffinose/stachyose/melibiose transport system substrate-binding protein